MQLQSAFSNKRVLVTGHTGFKGSWLGYSLKFMNADIFGISLDIPTSPSHYMLDKSIYIEDLRLDIRNLNEIKNAIREISPDFIFHLAAQPIVLDSYEDPVKTFETNTIGTLNVLESIRCMTTGCSSVIITSDKCYENVEKNDGYKESDRLGGKDPYSASKGCAELIFHSYYNSFFSDDITKYRIATARAGNVIGGGDWAKNRVVPDCMQSWNKQEDVILRSPNSTRPWQHVLEPISGYLKLAAQLKSDKRIVGESYNFGPSHNYNKTVKDLVTELMKPWKTSNYKIDQTGNVNEANLLALDCEKARNDLRWSQKLSFKQTADWTANWYHTFYTEGKSEAFKITKKQISEYFTNLND